jgi:hypothetical protein
MDKSKCPQPMPIEQQACTSSLSALCSTIRWSTGPWDDVNKRKFQINRSLKKICFYLISVQQHVVQVYNNVVFIVMIHHVLGFAY